MFARIHRILLASALLLAAVANPAGAQVAPDSTPNLLLQVPNGSGGFLAATIQATLRQPDGKILVAGDFTRLADGTPRSRLLRLNADGSLDSSFSPVFSSVATACVVYSLTWANNSIYAGGTFDAVNGTNSPNVVRLDRNGSVASGWSSPFAVGSPGQPIRALAATSSSLFVGGDIQLNNAFGLARLDAFNGNWDFSWIAQTQNGDVVNPPSGGTRGEVRVLSLVDGDLLVGGDFLKIANVLVRGLARISQAAPVSVRAFDAGLSGSSYRVSALQRSGSKLYIGGTFFRQVAPFVGYLNRVDISTGVFDSAWQPSTNGSVEALSLEGTLLYVGGSFANAIPPSGGNRLMRIPTNGNGAIDATWNTTLDDTVLSLAHDCHNRLIVGGAFDTAGGQVRNGLAGYQTPAGDCIFYSGFETP
jgi:hypothetical protein